MTGTVRTMMFYCRRYAWKAVGVGQQLRQNDLLFNNIKAMGIIIGFTILVTCNVNCLLMICRTSKTFCHIHLSSIQSIASDYPPI